MSRYVCRCGAYEFPHKAGSGKCKRSGWIEDAYCEDCGSNDYTKVEDGIGGYDYGSKHCNDVHWTMECRECGGVMAYDC